MLKGKFARSDIESPSKVYGRVVNGIRGLRKDGVSLVFSHSGVLQMMLLKLDIYDLYLHNCGSLGIVVNSEGVPQRLIAYWNHGY